MKFCGDRIDIAPESQFAQKPAVCQRAGSPCRVHDDVGDPDALADLGHAEVNRYFAKLFTLQSDRSSICGDKFVGAAAPNFVSRVTLTLVGPRNYEAHDIKDVPCSSTRFGILDFDLIVTSPLSLKTMSDLLEAKLGTAEGYLNDGRHWGMRWPFRDGVLVIGKSSAPNIYHFTLAKTPPRDPDPP